ncbi:unnamed protein product [Urochloa humidicola]
MQHHVALPPGSMGKTSYIGQYSLQVDGVGITARKEEYPKRPGQAQKERGSTKIGTKEKEVLVLSFKHRIRCKCTKSYFSFEKSTKVDRIADH